MEEFPSSVQVSILPTRLGCQQWLCCCWGLRRADRSGSGWGPLMQPVCEAQQVHDQSGVQPVEGRFARGESEVGVKRGAASVQRSAPHLEGGRGQRLREVVRARCTCSCVWEPTYTDHAPGAASAGTFLNCVLDTRCSLTVQPALEGQATRVQPGSSGADCRAEGQMPASRLSLSPCTRGQQHGLGGGLVPLHISPPHSWSLSSQLGWGWGEGPQCFLQWLKNLSWGHM